MVDVEEEDNASPPRTLAGTAVERSNLYGFLAEVFRIEPSARFLRRIKEPAFAEALRGAGVELDSEFLHRPEAELEDELAVEYARLFVGPGKHVSPHESVQTEGGSGVLWGPETAAVKRFIEAAGFEYRADFHGLPDHLGVELEFMAEIARQEAAAWRHGDFAKAADCLECERRFLAGHLASWAFAFCTKVEEAAALPFYGEMARLTADFLGAEEKEIARRLAAARSRRDQADASGAGAPPGR